jgi:hypothetical protein
MHLYAFSALAGLVFGPAATHSPLPVAREIVTPCAICGDLVRSAIELGWKPSKKARKAHFDMQEHLMTHSFAELLRHEIRQDLEQVPEEQRASIVRDVYRGLLGTTRDGRFTFNDTDTNGVYSIDEVLGSLAVYRLWRTANHCGAPGCLQH